jgi:hypothetical protein
VHGYAAGEFPVKVGYRKLGRFSPIPKRISPAFRHRCSEWTQAARCVRACCATPREPVMLALMEELDSLYERARKQPAPEPQQGGYCHIIETGTAETQAGTSPVSDYYHREA